ncbi:MAG: LysR family transcriptional regulator, partial [Hamadaea sp.]|nr:LysR family transcriptional regulator [Hamadaea sp.]
MTARDLLEPDALRAFAVFAEHRNFTAAAARLHLSQPSLHAKIAKLAAALGVRLYERDGRSLVLTAEGRRLAAYAQDERRRVDDFLATVHSGDRTLAIAAGRGALRWVVSDAIRRIAADGHRIRLLVLDREAALAALATGEADVAVTASDPPPRTLRSAEIAAYAQVLVIPGDHRLARRRRVALRDLDGLDLVVPPADRPHRRALDRALLDAGV